MPDQLFFDIVKMVVALACVIGLVFAVVMVLKRFLPGATRPAGERMTLQVLSQLSVGPRQKLCIVRVQDRTLVVGVTEGSINTLAELSPQRSEAQKEVDDPKIFSDLLAWRKDAPAPVQRSATSPAKSGDDFSLAPLGKAKQAPVADRGDGPPLFAPGERPAR